MTSLADNDALVFLQATPRLYRRPARWRPQTILLGVRLVEAAAVMIAALLAALQRPTGSLSASDAVLAACAATVAAFEAGRPHGLHPFELRRRALTLALQVAAAVVAGALVLRIAGVATRPILLWAASAAIAAAALLAVIQALYAATVGILGAEGRLARYVAVVGTGPLALRLRAQLEAAEPGTIRVVGLYAPTESLAGADHARGTMRTLLCDCRLELVDDIVLALEPGRHDALDGLRRVLTACIQNVFLAPELAGAFPAAPLARLGASRLPLLACRPIGRGAALAKRGFDLAGALALLAVMAPLFALIALAIRLSSPGPILFRQLRIGYNNQLFHILKFRSMHHGAADRLAKQQTVRGDPRITRVGRIIRKLSLDELPQLLNVLAGDMSLVGPRPHAPGTSIGGRRVHTLVPDYASRHRVRPGITGLAQVRGLRGGLHDRHQVVNRTAADLEYIERWSLWLDVRILLGTVLLELRNSRGC